MIDAFKYRMISDVPVGVFLSGGIDSSIVAAMLQRTAASRSRPSPSASTTRASTSRTTRDGSPTSWHLAPQPTLDVAEAQAVAAAVGRPLRRAVRRLLGHSDLSSRASPRERVKVVLSADGGDELFSGYNSYATALAPGAAAGDAGAAQARHFGMTSALQVSRLDDG